MTLHVALGARGSERISARDSSVTRSMSSRTTSNRFILRSRFASAASRLFFAVASSARSAASSSSSPSAGSGFSSGDGSASASAASSPPEPSAGVSAASSPSADPSASASAIFASISACSSSAAARISARVLAAASNAFAATDATRRIRSLSSSRMARPLPPVGVFSVSMQSMPATSPVSSVMGTAKKAPTRGNPRAKCTVVHSGSASSSGGSTPSGIGRGAPRKVIALGTSIQGALGVSSTSAKDTPAPRSSLRPTSQSWSWPLGPAAETYRKNISP